jgi:hypothetical protein
MKAVFFVGKDNYSQAKNKVYTDEAVSRASITIREGSALGLKKQGYYIQVDGDEPAVRKAVEVLQG